MVVWSLVFFLVLRGAARTARRTGARRERARRTAAWRRATEVAVVVARRNFFVGEADTAHAGRCSSRQCVRSAVVCVMVASNSPWVRRDSFETQDRGRLLVMRFSSLPSHVRSHLTRRRFVRLSASALAGRNDDDDDDDAAAADDDDDDDGDDDDDDVWLSQVVLNAKGADDTAVADDDYFIRRYEAAIAPPHLR